MQVELDIDGHGVAPDCGWHLSASSTDILGDYALQPDAVDPSNVDLIGDVGVSFSGFNDSPTWGLCDFPLIGDLIQLIVGDLEQNVLPSVLASALPSLASNPGGSPCRPFWISSSRAWRWRGRVTSSRSLRTWCPVRSAYPTLHRDLPRLHSV
jgi:hypothetical protein